MKWLRFDEEIVEAVAKADAAPKQKVLEFLESMFETA